MRNHTLTILSIGASLGVTAIATAEPNAHAKPKSKHHLTFAQADGDISGGLTVFEFALTQGQGTPLVEIRRRFLPIDVAGDFEVVIDPATDLPAVDPVTGEPLVGDAIPDGVVSLEEWNAWKALEEKPKSDLGRFDLADFDGDDQLSLVELGYLTSPKSKASKNSRKFNKLDTDDDGFISRVEFKKPAEVDEI